MSRSEQVGRSFVVKHAIQAMGPVYTAVREDREMLLQQARYGRDRAEI